MSTEDLMSAAPKQFADICIVFETIAERNH